MTGHDEAEYDVPLFARSAPLSACKQCESCGQTRGRTLLSVVLPVYNEAAALPVLTARIAAVLAPLPLRGCEKMGTGSDPTRAKPGKSASGEVPVPIFSHRGCEQMGTGSDPTRANRGKSASGEVPVPIFSQPLRYEIVFVNDGSSDESLQVLDQLAATSDAVRVVHLSRNFGHQAAVQAGLAHARGQAIVLMDSDMQDAPEAIPRFLAAWREGYDVVYAVRTRRKEHFLKRIMFSAFHRLMSAVASVPIPADAGIFGLVDRRVARQILALGESDRYFPGLRSWVGFSQKGILVERNARYDRHPRVSMLGLVRLAKTAMFSFSTFPLRIFQLIGAAAAIVFLMLGGYALFCRLLTDQAIPGWTSQVLSASFFGALNALGISILGEYVIRIYDQVRRRPQYVVDRTVNFAAESDADDATGDAPYAELLEEAEHLLAEASMAEGRCTQC